MKDTTRIALLHQHLRELKLDNILEHYPELMQQAEDRESSYEEFLLSLTELELRVRAQNSLNHRIEDARFPLLKTLESFDLNEIPGPAGRLIQELMNGEYIVQHRNVIILGEARTGKTHLAIALGVEACRQGVRTRFVTSGSLAHELIEARRERALSRLVGKYDRYGLLILDELGAEPFSPEGAELVFEVLAERHKKASVIIASRLEFAEWTQIFGETTLTNALVDRLTHNAAIITLPERVAVSKRLSIRKDDRGDSAGRTATAT
ncbi:MAG: IS21-like element helper ATPase IstB [bacterium]